MPSKKKAGEAAAKKAPARKRSTATKKAAKAEPAATGAAPGGQLRVKQIRSGIGHADTYRRTLEALGLKYHQHEVVVRDHPAVRGMLRKVWNLVSVRPVEG
jgi:ribosomal protein L30